MNLSVYVFVLLLLFVGAKAVNNFMISDFDEILIKVTKLRLIAWLIALFSRYTTIKWVDVFNSVELYVLVNFLTI